MGRNDRTRRLRRAVVAAAVLYPVSLAALVAALRFVGEGWCITTAALYLPRLLFSVPLPFLVAGLVACSAHRWLWTQSISALLLGFPLLGLVVHVPRAAELTAPTMRVLSYNINKGHGGLEKLAQEVQRFSPDVVVMQEIERAGDGLARVFQPAYATVEASGQFFVASRFPVLSSVDAEPLPIRYDGLRHYHAYVIDSPIGRVRVLNVRPTSPSGVWSDLRTRGMTRANLSWALQDLEWNTRLRELEARTIAEAAKESVEPVVIAGDTNLPGLSRILGRYLSPFRDAFVEAGSGLGYTFPGGRWPYLRIDRILMGPGLRAVRFERGTSTASDHLCVVSDVAPTTR
jgi:endonuclease/exonuclease/phosphatase family metal-dependent hydrolase